MTNRKDLKTTSLSLITTLVISFSLSIYADIGDNAQKTSVKRYASGGIKHYDDHLPEARSEHDKLCAIGQGRANSGRKTSFFADREIIIPESRDSVFVSPLIPFGGRNKAISVSGNSPLAEAIELAAGDEDNGSIPFATDVFINSRGAYTLRGEIGDGEFGANGTGTGDFDFYRLVDLKKGQFISLSATSINPEADDFGVFLYDAQGNNLGFEGFFAQFDGEDIIGEQGDTTFLEVPADGDYYLMVADFFVFEVFPEDPFDASSGTGLELPVPLSEGEYSITVGLDYSVSKTVQFFTRPGTVVSAATNSENVKRLDILDPADKVRMRSQSSVVERPVNDPLPDGSVEVVHLVDTFGLYEVDILISGPGPFSVDLFAGNPPLAVGEVRDTQTLFIDFDGEEIDASIFEGDESQPVFLEPLADFMSAWDLSAEDEDTVINIAMAELERILITDVRNHVRNRKFNIRLLNSRDHEDPWGDEHVSRVIVGGSSTNLPSSLRFVVGAAQSIDTGNFATAETALVLLNRLSGPTFRFESLNRISVADGKKAELVGKSLAHFIAHEAGHFLGNFHVEEVSEEPQVMASFPFVGGYLGEDEVFGTDDDQSPNFGNSSSFWSGEIYQGNQNTAGNISFGSTTRFGPRFINWN